MSYVTTTRGQRASSLVQVPWCADDHFFGDHDGNVSIRVFVANMEDVLREVRRVRVHVALRDVLTTVAREQAHRFDTRTVTNQRGASPDASFEPVRSFPPMAERARLDRPSRGPASESHTTSPAEGSTRKSAPNRTYFPGAPARPAVSVSRQKHQVGRFPCIPEKRPARRAQLRAHGKTTSEIRDLDPADGHWKVRRDFSRADPVPKTTFH